MIAFVPNDIWEATRTLLTAALDVPVLVAPAEGAMPYVRLDADDHTGVRTDKSTALVSSSLTLNVFARTRQEAADIATAIAGALEDERLAIEPRRSIDAQITNAQITQAADENGAYHQATITATYITE